jgi:hypothetical protein
MNRLVSCYHFLIFCTIVFSLAQICGVLAESIWPRNGETPWRAGQLEKGKHRLDGFVC